MSEAAAQLPAKHAFFGIPKSWLGWASIALMFLSVFFRRLGGFRAVFGVAILAGALALASVLWKKERSVLVWVPFIVGALAAVVVVLEIVFPH